MTELDRVVAGVRCAQVLERLSDYLDGELAPHQRRRVEAHLAGCDGCERFGGRMAAVVSALRTGLGEPGPLDAGTAARLRERLARDLQGRTG